MYMAIPSFPFQVGCWDLERDERPRTSRLLEIIEKECTDLAPYESLHLNLEGPPSTGDDDADEAADFAGAPPPLVTPHAGKEDDVPHLPDLVDASQPPPLVNAGPNPALGSDAPNSSVEIMSNEDTEATIHGFGGPIPGDQASRMMSALGSTGEHSNLGHSDYVKTDEAMFEMMESDNTMASTPANSADAGIAPELSIAEPQVADCVQGTFEDPSGQCAHSTQIIPSWVSRVERANWH